MRFNPRSLGFSFLVFIGVFVLIYKDESLNLKGVKRFVIAVRIALIITFSVISAAPAKSSAILPGAEAFPTPTSTSRLVKTGSGVLIGNKRISEALKYTLEVRSGDLGKSGPGPRAKADAKSHFKNRSRSSSPFVDGFVPQRTYCQYHKSDPPLSCKTSVKVSDSPFQGDGDNNQPPSEDTNFDASQYKGGPNPFLDKFDYDNPNHSRKNVDFSSEKHMNHAYDRHAERCFGMKENRNKENLKEFEGKSRGFIESPETEKINGSYRYETPAYFYKEKDGNLVAIVNATDNSFITLVNATEFQLNSIQDNKNFGLDTRPSMQLTLRLRGPKNQN